MDSSNKLPQSTIIELILTYTQGRKMVIIMAVVVINKITIVTVITLTVAIMTIHIIKKATNIMMKVNKKQTLD